MTLQGESTDDELDAFLTAAHSALLHHLDRHTDLLPGLVAFMDGADSRCTHLGRTVIELRNLTRTARDSLEVSKGIIRARPDDDDLAYLAFLLSLSHAFGAALDLTRALNLDYRLHAGHEPALSQTRMLKHALDHALGLSHRLDLGLTLALARARKHTHELNLGLTFGTDRFSRPPGHRLDRELNRILNLALDLNHVPGLGRFFNRVTHLDRADARSIDDSLMNAVTRILHTRTADVSGADLSDLRVADIEVFAGALWTRSTVWPEGIGPLIEERSDPIGSGVYRVRGGTENDPHDSVLV
ncbi:hypothetical protein [Actinocorallia libanotica]|uniref:Uncharacterized protein n=1 Tax=Actinocorallia libanotica TaxID=46162 RepID=A0ABP4B7M0_9ACTN